MKTDFALESAVMAAALIGAGIIENGGEIERAEDAAFRICRACHADNISVFALYSIIFVSASCGNSKFFTFSRRIKKVQPNMVNLEQINAVSRQICSGKTSIKEARLKLENMRCDVPWQKVLLGEIITAVSFTLFYGGKLSDVLCAAGFAIILHFEKIAIKKIKISPYIGYAAITFVPSLAVQIAQKFNLCTLPFAIIPSCLISMFPGITLVNATLSFISSNTISAILQLISSIMITLSIALGFVLSLSLQGVL